MTGKAAADQEFKVHPLQPHERFPWNFRPVGPNVAAGADELVHLRVAGQTVPCGDHSLPKKYKWSCPFQVETLQSFTVKVEPDIDAE